MTVNKWLSVVYELSGCGFQFRCCDLDINIEIKVETFLSEIKKMMTGFSTVSNTLILVRVNQNV